MGSGITEAEALGAITEFFNVVEDALEEGLTVNLPLVKLRPTIKGLFNDSNDSFHKDRHELIFTASPGKKLKTLAPKVKLTKTIRRQKEPKISKIVDIRSGKIVKIVNPEMILEIHGRNFVFPKNDEEVGVFVVDAREQVKAKILKFENSGNILVLLPDELPQSNIRLKIVVRFQHHLKTILCYSELMKVNGVV